MKLPRLLVFLLLCLRPLSGQESSAASPPSQAVIAKLQEAQELQQKQKYTDALSKLDEIEELDPNLPDIHNMRGAIYLTPQLRDFEKAAAFFDKAEALRPGELAPKFNKAELLFVKHDYAASQAAFEKLLTEFPKLPLQVRHLVIFKRLVCEVKQDQIEAAEKTLKENFTFMDDTPAYYFGKASIAFQKKDEAQAKDWLNRANGIFKPAESSAYLDTLMEVRWVPNIGLPPVETK